MYKNNNMGLKLSRRLSLMSKKQLIMIAIFSILSVTGIAKLAFAQDPSLDIAMRVQSSGQAPFDSSTYDPAANTNAGQDQDAANNVVRVLDYVTYRADVSINDADQTNVVVRFRADLNQKWTTIPRECATTGVSPASTITDLDAAGDKRLIICNLGDVHQGTKFGLNPVAQVISTATNASVADETACNAVEGGAALDTNTGCVSANASVQSAQLTTPVNSRTVSLITTLGFKIDMTKTASRRQPEVNNTTDGRGTGTGKVVQYVVTAAAVAGSGQVNSGGTGVRDFTLTDTFENAPNGWLYTGDSARPGCQTLGDEVTQANITCTQTTAGGPITIQLNNVDVTYPEVEGRIFTFKIRLWVPTTDVTDNGACTDGVCTLGITNHITGIDTPITAAPYNENTIMESVDGIENYNGAGDPGGQFPTGPGDGNNVATATVDTVPVGAFTVAKGFYSPGNNFSHPGTMKAAPNQIVPTQLNVSVSAPDGMSSTGYGMSCDAIDTSRFTFVGTPGDFEPHANPAWGGNFTINSNLPNPLNRYRYQTSTGGTSDTILSRSDIPGTEFRFEYTNVAHSNALTALRTYSCADDLNGDGSNDWVADYTTLPGGADSVTAVRLVVRGPDWNEMDSKLADPNSGLLAQFMGVYNLKLKDDALSTAYTVDTGNKYLANFGIRRYKYQDSSTEQYATAAVTTETMTEAQFSIQALLADRLQVVPSITGVQKDLASGQAETLKGGETAEFRVVPSYVGSGGEPATNLILRDVFPTTPTAMTYVSSRVDPTCTTNNGTYGQPTIAGGALTVTVSGVSANQPVCAYLITLRVPDGARAGTYVNNVSVTSSDDTITANSKLPNGNDPNDNASIQVLSMNGYEVVKTNENSVYEINQNITQRLTYSNLGGEDYSAGNFIDVLPYNGDHGNFTQREDTLTPDTTKGSEYTNNDGAANAAIVGLASAPTGANGEVFSYTTANPATIPIDPCHSANQPAGFVPSAGHYCYQAYLDNGNEFDDGAVQGAGTIAWSTTPPANLQDVTAIRWSSTAHAAGQPARTVNLTLAPLGNREGDIYCNNFGGRIPEIALEITSNDVCERVVAGTISGTVFNDRNASGGNYGANNGDVPYGSVRVQLLDANGDPYDMDPLTPGVQPYIVTTNSAGFYQFSNLPSGTYQTAVLNPPTPHQTYDFDDNDPNIPATFVTQNNSGPITLSGPNSDPNATDVSNQPEVDYGYTAGASLGDYVWYDTDRDGIQDPGEEGIEGVKVELLDADGNVIATTTTNADGFYEFTGLPAGTYEVRFTPPAGYNLSPKGSGSDRGRDSNADPISFRSGQVTLEFGENNPTIDAGMFDPAIPVGQVPAAPDTGFFAHPVGRIGAWIVATLAVVIMTAAAGITLRRRLM